MTKHEIGLWALREIEHSRRIDEWDEDELLDNLDIRCIDGKRFKNDRMCRATNTPCNNGAMCDFWRGKSQKVS